MAVYKVIQDIEAEDKLLGPLTLKGFIYAIIAGALAFINFRILFMTELGYFRILLLILFGLPMLLFGVLASPLGREQPTEIWLLSRIRFFLKTRRRIWDQGENNNLVTITAPKKVEQHLTKELSQNQVESRLKALAMTMDTGGWAVKNVSVNLNPVTGYLQTEGESDRLVDVSVLPQEVPVMDIHPADDIMDAQNNPTAQKFDGLMKQKDAERKQNLVDKLASAVRGESDDNPAKKHKAIKPQKGQPAFHVTDDEGELNREFSKAEKAFRTSRGDLPDEPVKDAQAPSERQVTDQSRADKLELAQSGSDLSVASIEKLANRQPRVQQIGPNEVVISLH